MMMFASDLDRTLIYSERALSEFKEHSNSDLVGVERRDGLEVAFMTKDAFESLRELAENILFVPVTTRTYEQFQRIFMFSEDIPLTYAVTSNGANIIYNGKPLTEWREFVQKRLEKECTSLEAMIQKIKGFEIKGKLKKAESLFFYYILDEIISLETGKLIRVLAEANGWRVSIQGRKLYLVPKPVCKGEAVKFIKEREGIHTVFGAGDSLLDHDFLKVCEYPFVPLHGELANEKGINYLISQRRGIKAGEEILFEITDILKKTV
ncbi:hypothetical protein BGM26_08150 [Bacillus sp. FJAT-29790]|uniref:HAD family hydrolase n=1 Tax=Bacillus sp. FJAT-29790 TaxID=1895002 RepID=UPI001C244261|nr:HAD family hydrolase [Bacillus sp. FJAT-29790]MBU8878956.1 hypothetical protein [Bacillus sp. FJAT-29790]